MHFKVHEVVDRVDDLQKNWPPEWGEIDGNIGVFAPYSDQVSMIITCTFLFLFGMCKWKSVKTN